MKQQVKRGLAAGFALAVLAACMVHAGTSSGCARSNPQAAAAPDVAQQAPSSAAPPTQEQKEEAEEESEMHFPASKAGSFAPRSKKGGK